VGHDLPDGKDSKTSDHNPDFREWGNSYWNQNVRLLYWPLIATGDHDLIQPWFEMYNGGSGMITLQQMLMQCAGKRIHLLPAWPKEWTADFKLHAPRQTTVQGHVEGGKITKLEVTPESRTKDVIVVD
jgi:hypothetical protein